ncbi:MAG TPA: hypothetical protein VEF06_08305 [Bryobacteraceae bacterium]|nr:hypothetical protein [Bryobacteraceae bacterium]
MLRGFVPALAVLAGLLFAVPLLAGEDAPDPAEQQQIIAAIREAAMAFDRNLPNFICTQTTHRAMRREANLALGVRMGGSRAGGYAAAPATNGEWQSVDSFEQQLSYFDHRENYQLVKRNGRPAKKNEASPPGLTSSGEFGSTLIHIFEKESKADFEWKRSDTLRGHPVYVFAFQIAKENSAAQMTAGDREIVVAYHGLVFADKETKTVLRVTTEAEVPADFPLQGATHLLDYGNFSIAGEKYVLPLHAEVETRASEEFMRSGRIGDNSKLATLRNTVDFTSYRKYATDAILKPE